MMKLYRILILFFILYANGVAKAQIVEQSLAPLFTEPKHYVCYRTNDSIFCDGKLDEKDWAMAQWTDLFVDIEGALKAKPYYETKIKMLYDKENLYIAAELKEQDIWAYLTLHDDTIYHDNDFEIFLDPECSTHNYFEIEINALKTVFDLYMNRPYRNAGSALINWDIKGLKVGIDIEGTLNSATDKDKKWVVEMAIPFTSLSKGETRKTPVDKEIWRVNFSRVEWDSDFKEGRYQQKKDAINNQLLPEHNWVWSPQGVINMHYPERWGFLQFTSINVGEDTISFEIPYAERIKRYLWLFYYKEMEYVKTHKIYCSDMKELNYKHDKITVLKYKQFFTDVLGNIVTLQATEHQFEVVVENKEMHEKWMINQEGEIFNRTEYEQKGFH